MTWHPVGMGKALVGPLRQVAVLAFVLAVAAAVAPGTAGDVIGAGLVAVLVAAPLLRVAFFVGRWWQIGDHRYALLALLLLAEIGAGAAFAFA